MSDSPSQGKYRVLIVEDNPADRLLIHEALAQHHMVFELEDAHDGEQALAAIQRIEDGAAHRVDVVILDLNLGTHHGVDILKRIRGNQKMIGTAVIVLTASESEKEQQNAEEHGLDLFLRKSMILDEFLRLGHRVSEVMAKRLA